MVLCVWSCSFGRTWAYWRQNPQTIVLGQKQQYEQRQDVRHWELSESSWVVLIAVQCLRREEREVRWGSHRSSCQLSREAGCRVPVKGFQQGCWGHSCVSGLMALNHFPHTEMKSKIRILTTLHCSLLVPQLLNPVLDFQWCPSWSFYHTLIVDHTTP